MTIKHGKPRKTIEVRDGAYPILGSGGIIGRTNSFLFDKPSVLIGRKGTIDKPQYMASPFWTVDTLFYTALKNGNSAKFFYYVFSAINWRRYNEASGVPSLSSSTILSIDTALPSLAEQTKIERVLSQCDETIETLGKLITAKEKLKKGMAQQLLTGKKRFKKFKNHRWKLTKLKIFLIPTIRATSKPNEAFLSLGIRSHGKGIFHKCDFEPEDIALDELYEVKENDLIVNITFAWEGAVAIASSNDDGGLVSHRFPTYMFKLDKMLPAYMKHVIQQKRFVFDLGLVSPGGAGRNRVLNKSDFLNIQLNIPNIEEQQKIASVLNTADKEIYQLKEKLELLKQQKKGLMQKLLTGEIRVKI
ncbi:MAG: hypothetical protein A2Y12_03955 [Planctomycetes bacterium GWF2_42_9]|nr:MAG: hypothetical protein A2Y12_03955 [Planctomycetes bacterium GWF2_42_9]